MIQHVSFRRIFQPISLAVACLSWLTGCAQSQPAPVAAAENVDLSQLPRIQQTYAETMRRVAKPGQWVQTPDGSWQRKE